MSTDIWVLVEPTAAGPSDAGLAVLTEAVTLTASTGGRAVAVLVGEQVAAADVTGYGAAEVVVVAGTATEEYSTEGWTTALADAIAAEQPGAVLLAATALGSDLAPRLAARLRVGLVSDVTGLSVAGDGRVTFTKNTLGGNLLTECVVTTSPQLGTVRTGLFRKGSGDAAPAPVRTVTSTTPVTVRVTTLEVVPDAPSEQVALEDARIVVSGGRAMGSAESFAVLHELAAAFGPDAAVGSSRPAADAGWVPQSQEIGISGKTVSPDLYLACGISGASQHLAGMSSSKTIVAINSDAGAPIFDVADLGVVGDLFELVPALSKAVARHRG